MLQFNQQYIRDYLKPFIAKVLTDMSTCEQKGEPMYLINILNGTDLSGQNKIDFESDYFQGTQPDNRPFTKDSEASYRKMFISELVQHVDTQTRLSNPQGMREALLPDPDSGKTFGSHQALTLNLNRLAIQMARNFEKRKITEKMKEEGAISTEDERKIENGELKIVTFVDKKGNEEEVIAAEGELPEMAAKRQGKAIIPLVQPDLAARMHALPLDDQGEEHPAETPPEAAQVQEVQQDFSNAKVEAIRQLLLESGLEVEGDLTIEEGIVMGTVRDVEGQELKVTVDTNKPNHAADKFIFEFTDRGPSRDLTGKQIPVSQSDLRETFFDEEGRKKASDVFRTRDARGTMAGEKPLAPPPVGQRGVEQPEEQVELPVQPGKVAEGQPPAGGAIGAGGVEASVSLPQTQIPGIVQKGGVVPPEKLKLKKEEDVGIKLPKGAKIRGPEVARRKTESKSVMKRKKELEERRKVGVEAPSPQGPTLIAMQAPRVKRGKKKWPWPAKFGLGAGGATGGLIGAGTWYFGTMQPEETALVIKTVLSCLGMSCLV